MNEVITGYTTEEKLEILADAAKYDVACTSSGADRRGRKGMLGNCCPSGVCHSFAADGRCISLLKVLMTNHCIYDCRYCANRASNDVRRATFEPDELCRLVIEFYKRNYIEGLFLSSAVLVSPDYTMERMYEILYLLRTKYRFNGYIHVKTIPGASDEILARIGYLTDRISINIEQPTEAGLRKLAPNKTFKNILEPMGKVTNTIASSRLIEGKSARMERSTGNNYLPGSIFNGSAKAIETHKDSLPVIKDSSGVHRNFAPAGQSTQMIVGALDETDYTLITTTQQLYQMYDLKRVFYSAYIPINDVSGLPEVGTAPPLLREHRLYQADWLLRFYGFKAEELFTPECQNLDERIDPKCNWALRHIEQFPIEVMTAPYDLLLKIPGIGPKSAQRIVNSRRFGSLNFDTLKRIGVVLKRAHYFITCGGRMMYNTRLEEKYLLSELTMLDSKENWNVRHQNEQYRQMTLFDFGVNLGGMNG